MIIAYSGGVGGGDGGRGSGGSSGGGDDGFRILYMIVFFARLLSCLCYIYVYCLC